MCRGEEVLHSRPVLYFVRGGYRNVYGYLGDIVSDTVHCSYIGTSALASTRPFSRSIHTHKHMYIYINTYIISREIMGQF